MVWGHSYDLARKTFATESKILGDQIESLQPKNDVGFCLKKALTVITSAGEHTVVLDEESFYQELYNNQTVYDAIGKEMCIVLDAALGASGCEAVVEGFYSLVKLHKKNGGQLNETLMERSIVNWVMLHPFQSPETIIRNCI